MNKYSKCLQLLFLLQLPASEKNKVHGHVRMRVRVRGRGRNTVWALLGSGEFSNKEHILQTARELFLLCAFTSPQAGNFGFFCGDVFKANYLQHAGLEPADLNLAKLLFPSRGALHGALVEGREGWVMGTSWLWGAAEDPAWLQSQLGFCGQKEWFGGEFFAIILRQLAWFLNSAFWSHPLKQPFMGNTTQMLWGSYKNHTGFKYLGL